MRTHEHTHAQPTETKQNQYLMRKKAFYEAPDAELLVIRVEENIMSDPQVTTDPRDDYGDEIIDLP